MGLYLLFSIHQYYPAGGAHDLSCDFDNLDEIDAIVKEYGCKYADSYHVLDVESGDIYYVAETKEEVYYIPNHYFY